MSRRANSTGNATVFFSKVQAKIKGNIKDMHHWSFMRGIHRWLVDSHHKGPPVSYTFLIRNLSLYEESCYFSSTNSLETTYSSPMKGRHEASFMSLKCDLSSAIIIVVLSAFRLNLDRDIILTSPNGNIFHVTGLLCGEFTGDRWIPHTKACDAELWRFLWSAPEWTVE